MGFVGLLLVIAALLSLGRDIWRVPIWAREGRLAALIGLLVASSFLSNLAFKYFWLVIMYGTILVNVYRMGEREVLENSSVRAGRFPRATSARTPAVNS